MIFTLKVKPDKVSPMITAKVILRIVSIYICTHGDDCIYSNYFMISDLSSDILILCNH